MIFTNNKFETWNANTEKYKILNNFLMKITSM